MRPARAYSEARTQAAAERVADQRLPLPQRGVDPEELTLCGYGVRLDNSDLGLEAAHIGWLQFGRPGHDPTTAWPVVAFTITL